MHFLATVLSRTGSFSCCTLLPQSTQRTSNAFSVMFVQYAAFLPHSQFVYNCTRSFSFCFLTALFALMIFYFMTATIRLFFPTVLALNVQETTITIIFSPDRLGFCDWIHRILVLYVLFQFFHSIRLFFCFLLVFRLACRNFRDNCCLCFRDAQLSGIFEQLNDKLLEQLLAFLRPPFLLCMYVSLF